MGRSQTPTEYLRSTRPGQNEYDLMAERWILPEEGNLRENKIRTRRNTASQNTIGSPKSLDESHLFFGLHPFDLRFPLHVSLAGSWNRTETPSSPPFPFTMQ